MSLSMLLAFVFLVNPLVVKAEMAPVIVSGRPGQSIGPGVVGSGLFRSSQASIRTGWMEHQIQIQKFLIMFLGLD